MKKILVIAYQLHYALGSECAVAWDYIRHMGERHKLTVLYGSSGEHHQIGNTAQMEAWCAENSLPNVEFIPVRPSFEVRDRDYSLRGIRGFYKDYRRWHDDVYEVVTSLLQKEQYDLIHFLGPIGYHEPGRLYDLEVPYIWGPVGGMARPPACMMLAFSAKYRSFGGLKLIVKSVASRLRLRLNPRVKKAFRASDVVICATTEYARDISRAIGKTRHCHLAYLPENNVDTLYDLNDGKFNEEKIRLIYIGRLDEGKAPMLMLEALAKVRRAAERFHLDILGEGPLLGRAKAFVERSGLSEAVEFHGRVERPRVFELLSKAHLMLLPTLYDANTTVVWEAMSHAVPTLCLDHCGMHDTIDPRVGIKIPVTSYRNVVDGIARQLQDIAGHPERLKMMAEALAEYRKNYTWEKRAPQMEAFYDLAQEQFLKRKGG